MKIPFLALLGCLATQSLSAYVLESSHWTLDRTVQMQLSLGAPAGPLLDGSTSFNQVAEAALETWNPYMPHMKFTYVAPSPVVPMEYDYEMSAAFSNTIFGDTFGSDTLGVTLISMRGNITDETDTLFNTAFTWNSYRGPLRPGIQDLRRVAIHEFGHSLGLDHPDDAGQTVVAIMNSSESNIDTVQPDDIAGAMAIYGTGPAYQEAVVAPVLANISTRGLAGQGDSALIGGFIVQGSELATVILRAVGNSLSALGLTNTLLDPTITVYDVNQNQVATNDDWITGATPATIASYHLDPPNSLESALYLTLPPGAYTAVVQSYNSVDEPAQSGTALFELYDLHTTGGRAGNISTRGPVLGGDNLLIGGFIISGGATKPVVLRALGPSLASEVSGALADPMVELHDADGNVIDSNDNWATGPDAAELMSENLAPKNAKESALQVTLSPGAYTAVVTGVNGAMGVGLVEIYDLSPAP